MGWTQYHATHYTKGGNVAKKKEVDSLFTNKKSNVVKSKMVGSTYYGAIQFGKDIVGVVVLTAGKNPYNEYFNFGYKEMSEDCGPCYYDCPLDILKLLTPTENKYANEWREKCKAKALQPKAKDLPVGTEIEWESLTLKKMAPNHQFKRAWWFCEEESCYVPATRIENFKIIKGV